MGDLFVLSTRHCISGKLSRLHDFDYEAFLSSPSARPPPPLCRIRIEVRSLPTTFLNSFNSLQTTGEWPKKP
ncbi:hypothetical protein BH11ARM2_BH11ARM2_20390 [soil metagenome]